MCGCWRLSGSPLEAFGLRIFKTIEAQGIEVPRMPSSLQSALALRGEIGFDLKREQSTILRGSALLGEPL